MRLTSALRSAVVASLLLAVPVLAAESTPTQAPASNTEQGAREGRGHKRHGHGGRFFHLEKRLDRAVAEGRITQAQADQFKTEGRQLREEKKALREAAGGQLTEEQRTQLKARMKAFKEKVKGAVGPKAAQPAQQ